MANSESAGFQITHHIPQLTLNSLLSLVLCSVGQSGLLQPSN